MNAPLLKPRPKRDIFFAMRVSHEEKAEIEEVAHQLNIPMSHLVRHLVMHGILQHKQALIKGGADGE